MARRSTKGRKFRGTKHGKGSGRWRVERRRYKKKDGTYSYYWNYRERDVRKVNGRRKVRYRKGGKGKGPKGR